MATITQGNVTIVLSDDLEFPKQAGSLSPREMRRLLKARKGVGWACEATAEAIVKNPDRIAPFNVKPERLASLGRMTEQIENTLVDLDALTVRVKQARGLIDEEAHNELRKVLAFVRSQEKFDPRVGDLVPALLEYFARAANKTVAEVTDIAVGE